MPRRFDPVYSPEYQFLNIMYHWRDNTRWTIYMPLLYLLGSWSMAPQRKATSVGQAAGLEWQKPLRRRQPAIEDAANRDAGGPLIIRHSTRRNQGSDIGADRSIVTAEQLDDLAQETQCCNAWHVGFSVPKVIVFGRAVSWLWPCTDSLYPVRCRGPAAHDALVAA